MKETIKHILQRIHIYHPLHAVYRAQLRNMLKRKYRKAFRPYAGAGFICNVCGARYTKFVSDFPSAENEMALSEHQVVAGYGNNILCPNCLSTARERLVLAFLQSDMDVAQKKILHLSPEKHLYDFLRTKATVITADIHPGLYKSTDKKVQYQDATCFDFSGNSFDLVIGNHILEHIPDDCKAMAEINRVLKPGGKAILQVPFSLTNQSTIETPHINDPVLQSKLYGQKDHVRIYALSDYAGRLRDAGFTVAVIEYKDLGKFYQYAIQENESFLVIGKPA